MTRTTGTVRWDDLEGGVWVLEAADGRRYVLDGGDEALRRDGLEVEVEGRVDAGRFSIGMTGPVLTVTRYRLR